MKKNVAAIHCGRERRNCHEYSLIAAGIALAIISAVQGTGTALKTKFTTISTSLK